jgi:hypothetical protein
VALVLVDCPHYAEAHRVCHLDGVISEILGDNPWRASDVLAFVTAVGLAAMILWIFYAVFELSFLLCPLLVLTHPALPGPLTAWQI